MPHRVVAHKEKTNWISLAAAPPGTIVRVMAFLGGQCFQQRMTSMGLYPGRELLILRGGERAWGPMLLAVGECRFGLGRAMAKKILVQPL